MINHQKVKDTAGNTKKMEDAMHIGDFGTQTKQDRTQRVTNAAEKKHQQLITCAACENIW